MTKRLTLILFLLFAAHLPLKGASDPRIQVLPNGVHTYVWERPESDEDVELRLVIPVGLIHEREGEAGAVYTLAQGMVDKARFFDDPLSITGIECYEWWDDTDRLDTTCFSVSLSSDHLERLPEIMELFATWAWKWDPTSKNSKPRYQPVFPCDEETELAGYAGREDPSPVNSQANETILSEFYNKTYRSLPIAVIAVGAFDPEWVEGLIAEAFSSTPPGDLGPLPAITPRETWTNQVDITLISLSWDLPAMMEIYLPRTSTEKLTSRQLIAAEFLMEILNERLSKSLDWDNDKYGLGGVLSFPTKACAFMYILCECPPDDVVITCILLDEELKQIILEGPTREELEGIREKLYTSFNKEEFTFDQLDLAEGCIDHFRGTSPLFNDDFVEGMQKAIATMTLDDIQTLAKSLKPLSKGRVSVALSQNQYSEAIQAQLEELFKQ